MVRVRDGVHLATDVYLSGNEPGPTVLIRLPYDKSGTYCFIPTIAAYFTARGFHVVAQDVRGKFRSEGETLLFVNEAADGYDTIDWLIQQEFSDGVVGMWGDSYYGYTQWAAVSSGHPALRAISPRVTGTLLGDLPVEEPGQRHRDVEMGVHRLYPCTFFHGNDTYHWDVDWSSRPYSASVEEFFETVGSRSISYDLWFPHPVKLRRFPFGHPFDAKPIPVLQTIGWWDNCAPWQWHDHRLLAEHAGWSHNEYLIIDSIDHESYHLTHGTKADERSAEEIDRLLPEILDPTIEFFDVFLRNNASPSRIPKVRWNLAHTEGLRESPSWPPPGTKELSLFLSEEFTLERHSPDAPAELTWIHDPDDLVPSPVENAFAFLQEYPDERSWTERDDVLAFDGETVGTDIDLVGNVRLDVSCHSSGPTMDLFVRLLDVQPDGSAHLIARGQQHILHPNPGTALTIDLGEVGYRLQSGHHLRLHIASSDFPEYVPQPGNGEHPWLAVEVERNVQTLLVGGPGGAVLTLHRLAAPATQGPDGPPRRS
jgi:predicted acyl esterase